MKKLLSILLILFMLVFGVSYASERYYITLDSYIQKYQEAVKTTNLILSQSSGVPDVQVDFATDDAQLLSFLIEAENYTVTGKAYPDTGVISTLQVFIKNNIDGAETAKMNVLSIFYPLSEFDNFMSALTDPDFGEWFESFSDTMNKGKTWNGYKVGGMQLNGVGGWLSSASFEYVETPPQFEDVPNAKGLPFYTEKYILATGQILHSGEYIVGKHIAAGEYSVSTTVSSGINFCIYRGDNLRFNEVLSPDNPLGRVVLEDGDNIQISGGKAIFSLLK